MNSTTKQIDAALRRLDSDPVLAADFDNLRRTEWPGKTRREAAALGLAALEAKQLAHLAQVRATAMKHLSTVAAKTFKKAVAAVASITAAPAASAYDKYRQLQKSDPRAASKFWEENQSAIKSQIKSR